MAQELVYTSASHGLFPGSSGFCTVAHTVGLSPVLVKLLESQSGYRHLFPPQSDQAALNPVNWVHGIVRFSQTPTHILSRIGDAGLDYTKRSNVIAHHLVLGPNELKTCGPAAILAQPDLMQSHWDKPPMEFPTERPIPDLPPAPPPLQCVHWERATGDAGWGGVLAESVLQARSACVLYEPGTDLLPLFAESIALLPESLRWKITFSTYVREVPTGGMFLWKGMLGGTSEAEQMCANKGILLIDLTTKKQQSKPQDDSAFVRIARTGVVAPPPPPPPPSLQPVFEEVSAPGTQSPAPAILAPPVDGGTYDIDESSTKKRKYDVGTWNSRYESKAVVAEKERKAKQIFYTIIASSFLAILILLTLLGDEFFNSGGMRKAVMESFGIGTADSRRQTADGGQQMVDSGQQTADGGQQAADEGQQEKMAVETPPPETPGEAESEKLRRLDEEQADADRLAEEERQAEFERLQKEAEEELERHKAEMRRAFAAIPAAFSLVEPWKKPFGGVELPKNVQKEFAPLFPYRDYLQVQWIPLVTPKGWWYHTERVPSVFLDDPYTQWNLVAHWAEEETEPTQRTQRSLKLNLAVLKFGEEGLEVEWNPQTAGLESNIEIVNKLPFSYLRISFGPNAITESGPGRELEKEPRPLPIPKRFVSEDNVTEIALAEIDFTKSVWFKDVSLWLPMQNKPFALSNKETTITRPANPVEKFDGVFGKDRFRIGLENLDLQASLVLEVSVRPETVKNAGNTLTATGEASDALWKKTVLFTVESDSGKNPSLTIPITAEAFPDRIEFRDTSQETQSEAIRERTVLTKTIREKTETLNSTKIETFRGEPDPTTAFELFKRSLQREIDDVRRKESQANEQFLAIPVARKSVLTGGFSIHYSVYLQGREETEPMLILTTPPR